MLARRLRFLLPMLSMISFVASLAVLAWAVMTPCGINPSRVASARHADAGPSPVGQPGTPGLETFQPLFQHRFQTPLYDPPPKEPPAVVKKPVPPPAVKLLATMPEPGGGHAMFDVQGATLVKTAGDMITDGKTNAELLEIADDHVVLRHQGRLITLKLATE